MRHGGILFIALLIAALIAAYLFATQSGMLFSNSAGESTQTLAPARQAQEAVDAVNERISQQYAAVEGE